MAEELHQEIKQEVNQEVKQTFIFDFDDLSPTMPGFDLLRKLKEHYQNFRCTCFTPAITKGLLERKLTPEKFKSWGKLIRETEWLEVAPHGFAHIRGEFLTTDKKKLKTMLDAIENTFAKVLEIPYVKVFKYPYWEGSKEAEELLKERGYTLAIDRNNPVVFTDIPTYIWNWSIDDMPIPRYHTIKAHGHIHLTNNGLDSCYPNLLKLPQTAEFKTIGEHLCLTNQTSTLQQRE